MRRFTALSRCRAGLRRHIRGARGGAASRRGFTLIELIISMVLIGILASFAVSSFSETRRMAVMTQAISEIRTLQLEILEYQMFNGTLPASLADIGREGWKDPWGFPYVYAPFGGGGGKGGGGGAPGHARKDRFLVPINSDFDLYSVGPDGKSSPPLTSANSRDDIIRANDGSYIGVAEGY